MNTREAFLRIIQVGTVDDVTADLALMSAKVSPDTVVTADNYVALEPKLEQAAIPVLQSLLSVSSTSEGGFSISTNKDGIKERLLFLATKHGLTEIIEHFKPSVPVIKARNLW
jgi:hypothetical protein